MAIPSKLWLLSKIPVHPWHWPTSYWRNQEPTGDVFLHLETLRQSQNQFRPLRISGTCAKGVQKSPAKGGQASKGHDRKGAKPIHFIFGVAWNQQCRTKKGEAPERRKVLTQVVCMSWAGLISFPCPGGTTTLMAQPGHPPLHLLSLQTLPTANSAHCKDIVCLSLEC